MIPYTNWVLITGCDSGFGLLTAQQLLALGYSVTAICLTEEGCHRLRQTTTYPSRLHAIQCDITNSNDLQRLQSELNSYKGGKLWSIVNNAGIVIPGYLDHLTVADFRKVMEVNCEKPPPLIHPSPHTLTHPGSPYFYHYQVMKSIPPFFGAETGVHDS